jgi:hypothetical protein
MHRETPSAVGVSAAVPTRTCSRHELPLALGGGHFGRGIIDFVGILKHCVNMVSWLCRHGLVALLVMALVGLSAVRALPSGVGVGHASAAMDRAPCDQDIKDVGSKDDAHGKGMTRSCALGFACASANFVAPATFTIPARIASHCAADWRVSGPVAGSAAVPEVRPPIRSI